jgi:hypothetical protein
MRRTLIFIILLSALLYAAPTKAQDKPDGTMLLARCGDVVRLMDNPQTRTSDYNGGFCLGFITGMEEARSAVAMSYSKTYEEFTKMAVLGIKMPEDVSYGQIARVLVKWLQDNPNRLHEQASLIYVLAMREAFPADVHTAKASSR